jgi:Nucleotidyltransferase of unknown function (DUF6036)
VPRQRSPFAKLFADLAKALTKIKVDWYLFGAQAALLYGSTRVTADVDVTVRLGARTVTDLIDSLKKSGFALRVQSPDFFEATRVLPLVHRSSNIPADVVLAGPGLEDAFMARSVTHTFAGVTVFVAAPEDLVVMKVLAGRDKDSADVREILAAHPVDLEQVRSTLAMLEAALDQSDLLPRLEHLARGLPRL